MGLAAHFFFGQTKNDTNISRAVDIEKLRELAATIVAGLSYELVDLEWKHESGRWVLRVFIDRALGGEAPPPVSDEPAAGVSLEDCSRASRSLSAELDVADVIGVPYTLEVSSPGLNRPLRAERDFKRFVGHEARIKTRHPVGDNRRNFRGRLKGVDGGNVKIEVDGREFEIPVADVEKANLEFEFAAGNQGTRDR